MQSEMAGQRQRNEAVRIQMQEESRQLRHERDVAHGQLTVLSKQHQAKLRQRSKEHEEQLDVARSEAAALETQLAGLANELSSVLLTVRLAEAALVEVGPWCSLLVGQADTGQPEGSALARPPPRFACSC